MAAAKMIARCTAIVGGGAGGGETEQSARHNERRRRRPVRGEVDTGKENSSYRSCARLIGRAEEQIMRI